MPHTPDRITNGMERAFTSRFHWWAAGAALSIVAAVQLVVLPQVAASSVSVMSVSGRPSVVSADADELGTNWYPNAGILPTQVNDKDFGELFDVTLPAVNGIGAGQIYAQPIVADGLLLIVTENDNAYGIDPSSGAIVWSRNFGPPWRASHDQLRRPNSQGRDHRHPGRGHRDRRGVLHHRHNPGDRRGAVADAGRRAQDRPGGNELPGRDPRDSDQRAGQDLQPRSGDAATRARPVNGVVYAAFGSHCDLPPWYGWIVGVTPRGELKDMWVDETGSGDGAGIWGPGGIVVDSAGNLYVATGNGNVPPVGPGLGVPQPSRPRRVRHQAVDVGERT